MIRALEMCTQDGIIVLNRIEKLKSGIRYLENFKHRLSGAPVQVGQISCVVAAMNVITLPGYKIQGLQPESTKDEITEKGVQEFIQLSHWISLCMSCITRGRLEVDYLLKFIFETGSRDRIIRGNGRGDHWRRRIWAPNIESNSRGISRSFRI